MGSRDMLRGSELRLPEPVDIGERDREFPSILHAERHLRCSGQGVGPGAVE